MRPQAKLDGFGVGAYPSRVYLCISIVIIFIYHIPD